MKDLPSKLTRTQESQELLTFQIQKLYEQQLGHQLSKITCQVYANIIVIVMEGIVTRCEQLLTESDHQVLAQRLRQVLEEIIRPQIKQLIEDVMSVKVVDFLCDAKVETDRAGAVAIFEFTSD